MLCLWLSVSFARVNSRNKHCASKNDLLGCIKQLSNTQSVCSSAFGTTEDNLKTVPTEWNEKSPQDKLKQSETSLVSSRPMSVWIVILLDRENICLCKKSNTQTKSHTTDSVNCGPQSKSIVTNDSICALTPKKGAAGARTMLSGWENSCTPLLRNEVTF